MPNQSDLNQEVPAASAEEKEKIERMNRIRQSLANADEGTGKDGSDLPKPIKKKQPVKAQQLDISVEDNPPPVQGSAETRAQKMAQIREALAMVERPASQPQKPARKGTLPPLRKKGTKSSAAKNAAAETVVAPQRTRAKTPPPVQQNTKSAAKLPPLKKAAPKNEPVKNPAPKQSAAPVQTPAPPQVKQPLPPLRKAGTAKNAAAETVKTPVKGEATPGMKPVKPTPAKTEKKKPEAPNTETAKAAKSQSEAAKAEPKASLPVGKISAILGGSAVGALAIAYAIVAVVFNNKFLPNTYVNNVDVSSMSLEEAETALMAEAKVDNLVVVTAQGESVSFDPQKFDAAYSLPENALDEAFSENRFLWIRKLFTDTQYTVEYDLSFSEQALQLTLERYGWGADSSEDAYISKNEGTGMYEIIPETIGDKFNKNVAAEYISAQMLDGKFIVEIQESGCYNDYLANIKTENLQEQLELCNKFAKCTITFDYHDRQEVLEGATIAEWVLITDGEIDFNRAMVEEFVANMAAKYDTIGKDLTFRSTLDGVITVPYTSTSLYGWQINQEATVEQILELLRAGESATVEPVYRNDAPANVGIGYCRDEATGDIGNTYIEVDISAQHVWFYKNGVLQMESDCVTGIDTNPDRRTTRGIFKIWSHEEDRILGQMDDEGYETFVNYWMPINYIGIGLHDAVWQGAFGGTRYLTGNGSHGCINLPLQFTKDLFYATENGIPVIIHE